MGDTRSLDYSTYEHKRPPSSRVLVRHHRVDILSPHPSNRARLKVGASLAINLVQQSRCAGFGADRVIPVLGPEPRCAEEGT